MNLLSLRILCEAVNSTHSFVQSVVDSGGEGIIVRKSFSYYEHGRSASLLKFKVQK